MSNCFIFEKMNINSYVHKDLILLVKTHASIPDPAVDSEGAEAPIWPRRFRPQFANFLRAEWPISYSAMCCATSSLPLFFQVKTALLIEPGCSWK